MHFDQAMKRYGLDPSEVATWAEQEGVDQRLLVELVHLASVRFRTLDRWGDKATFEREVGEILQRHASGAG